MELILLLFLWKGGAIIAKEYKAKQKVITKMTRDGLKEENLVTC